MAGFEQSKVTTVQPVVRRIAAVVALLVSALLLPGGLGIAQAAGTYTVVSDTLTVRTGPGTGYTAIGTVYKGAGFTLLCQWQGGTNVGGNATWDKVTFSNGLTGAISDYWTSTPSFNSYAPGTGDCNTTTTTATREQRAVSWANARVGAAGWDGWCERFAENAFGTQYKYASALADFNAQNAAGRISHSTAVPAGALAFFRNPYDGGNGHVEISRGDGTFVSTASTVRVVNLAYGGTFLGWVYAPASWPGV
jgi:uncharacterized protein YraI